MTIKAVFGKEQGNKNMRCTLVGEYSCGKLWTIDKEFGICLEKEDILYRLGYVGKQSEVDGELVTVISDANVKRHTDKAESCELMSMIRDICKNDYKTARERRSALTNSPKDRQNTTHVNINFYKLADMDEYYDSIVAINKRIKAHNEALDAADLREQEAFLAKEREETRKVLIQSVIDDAYIDGEDLVSLADEHDIKIPLRTRGWILNKMSDVKSDSMRWQPAKKSDRASDKVIPIYRAVRAAVIAWSQTKNK